jgi:mRNA interferase RelE/StbE
VKYRLVYTRRAERDIKKLDPPVKRQISNAIEKLENDPIGSSEKLVEPVIGTYRFRIGEYRVIFDMEGRISLFSESAIGRKYTEDMPELANCRVNLWGRHQN